MARLTRIFSYGISITEESEISPAFEVYLAECNLNCKFCSTRSDWGKAVPVREVLEELKKSEGEGNLKSLLFVGGEPSLHLDFIFDFVKKSETKLPVWMVSNLWIEKRPLQEIIAEDFGIVGTIYFGNNKCARSISGAKNYLQRVMKNLETIFLLGGKLRLRHLVLPGHLECCALPLLNLIEKKFSGLQLSIMLNYFPPSLAPEKGHLYRYLNDSEKERILRIAQERGLSIIPGAAPQSGKLFTENEAEFIIEADGRVVAKYATPELVLILNDLGRANGERRGNDQGN